MTIKNVILYKALNPCSNTSRKPHPRTWDQRRRTSRLTNLVGRKRDDDVVRLARLQLARGQAGGEVGDMAEEERHGQLPGLVLQHTQRVDVLPHVTLPKVDLGLGRYVQQDGQSRAGQRDLQCRAWTQRHYGLFNNLSLQQHNDVA